jgi:hypothetical protein
MLESRSRQPDILIEFFRGFPQSLQVNSRTVKLGHNRFLPNPFELIVTDLSPYHQRYIV